MSPNLPVYRAHEPARPGQGPLILGIDPGKTGALAFYDPATDEMAIHDVPIFKLARASGGVKTVVDFIQAALIVDRVVKDRSVKVWIETVGARPGEAPSYAFDFGYTTGVLTGICAAHFLSIQGVVPAKWKRTLAVPAAKDGARAVASRLMPKHAHNWPLVKHDGRAEAALIALYGSREPG